MVSTNNKGSMNIDSCKFRVSIRNFYLSKLPFNRLKSRNGVAIIMSYYGETEKVYPLL